jgi:hypothetical protein
VKPAGGGSDGPAAAPSIALASFATTISSKTVVRDSFPL